LATLDFSSGSLLIFKEEQYSFTGKEVDSFRFLLRRLMLFRELMHVLDGVPPPPHLDEHSGDLFHKLTTFGSGWGSSDSRLFSAWVDILQYPDTTYDLSNGESIVQEWKEADKASVEHWTAELSHCTVVAAALVTESAWIDGHIPSVIAELMELTSGISTYLGDRALILVHDTGISTTVPSTAFHTAAVDDTIVLLEGKDTPVVLRQKGDTWVFVGPLCVFGIMHGEAWADEDDNGQRLQEFMLV
jgi:hypothetical protein